MPHADGAPLIHIHEDDWAMRCLHPLAARAEVRAELSAKIEASARNRAPNGHGWTDLHLVTPPKLDFDTLALDSARLVAALAPLMPRVRRFYATAGAGFDLSCRDPWGSYEEDALCFGFDAQCFLKIDATDDRVAAIWFDCTTQVQARQETLLAAIRAVDALTPCLLVDYRLDAEGAVGDPAFMARYATMLRDEA